MCVFFSFFFDCPFMIKGFFFKVEHVCFEDKRVLLAYRLLSLNIFSQKIFIKSFILLIIMYEGCNI